MRGFLKWLGKVIGSALALVIIIALLPYASSMLSAILPDLSGAATTLSATLSRHMQESARLETMLVEEEGVMTSTTDALLLGEVQSVDVRYTYRASLGIDLRKVQLQVSGNTITLLLPDIEVLSDSLTPEEIVRKDFWYPLTDERLQTLLQQEQERLRACCLAENSINEQAWQHTVTALEQSLGQWIALGGSGVVLQYAPLIQQP